MNPGAQPAPDNFSRRSFLLFLLLAPACFLVIALIVAAVQYRQFLSLVAPEPAVAEVQADAEAGKRLEELRREFAAFAESQGPSDSLWLSARDLELLLNASPAAQAQSLRFRVELGGDSLIAHSTQPLQALQGKMAWLFKKIGKEGYLNARLEGRIQFNKSGLSLSPDRGFLNGAKVPRASLTRRGGLSPADFLADRSLYDRVLANLERTEIVDGRVLLVGKGKGGG